MLTRTIAAAALALSLAQAAAAEDASSTANPSTATAASKTDALPQELRQKLDQAGYKNIEIVPGSYLVNAQDKDGNNVMMRIGPDSMTVLTEASSNNPVTTGSGSSNNGSGSSPSSNTSGKN